MEKQGIRPRADTSTEAFKAMTNGMINQISAQPDALHIGSIPTGAPTCADDTCIMSTNMYGTKALISMAEYDSRYNRYEFSSNNTRVMDYQTKNNEALTLNDNQIDETKSETHLQRTSDDKKTLRLSKVEQREEEEEQLTALWKLVSMD